MTSAVMLVVCALLFLATRCQAQNSTDQCKGNEAGVLLANAACHIVCNGTDSFNGTNALNGTKCILSNNSTHANEIELTPANQGNKTATYGVCRNGNCVMANNTEYQAPESTNTSDVTANSTKAGSTTATKPAASSATSNSTSAATPTTMQSSTGAPGNVTTPAASGHSPLAASVLSVALAIGALLCRAT